MMEAMALGLPVVASDIAGHRDLIVPDETGYLVPRSDKAELARRVNLLLDNRPLAQQLGAAGRQRIERNFSVDAMVSRHAQLYRQLARR
jgi:glycosyltransferase involved in cell wall biosynthesis